MDALDQKIYDLLRCETLMNFYGCVNINHVINQKEDAIEEKTGLPAEPNKVSGDYYYLYAGIIAQKGVDPQGVKTFDGTLAQWIAALQTEIADLDAVILEYETSGEAIPIEEEYSDSLKQLINDHNAEVGYNAAVERRADTQALLDCLTG